MTDRVAGRIRRCLGSFWQGEPHVEEGIDDPRAVDEVVEAIGVLSGLSDLRNRGKKSFVHLVPNAQRSCKASSTVKTLRRIANVNALSTTSIASPSGDDAAADFLRARTPLTVCR